MLTIFLLSQLVRGKLDGFDVFLIVSIGTSSFFIARRPDAVAHGALPTLTESSALEQYPVAMTIRGGGRTTGEERGWLSITDGWLVVEGLRTTVSLKPDSISGVFFEKDATRLRLIDGRSLSLRMLQEARETTLPAAKGRTPALHDRLRLWQRGFRPKGEAVFPPRTLHPEVAARSIRVWFLAVFIATCSMLVAMTVSAPVWALGTGAIAIGLSIASLVQMRRFRAALPEMIV